MNRRVQFAVAGLGWLYAPTLTAFYSLSILALLYYRLDRETHAENLAALQRTRTELTSS